jgi:hypothetical protein
MLILRAPLVPALRAWAMAGANPMPVATSHTSTLVILGSLNVSLERRAGEAQRFSGVIENTTKMLMRPVFRPDALGSLLRHFLLFEATRRW